MTDNSVSPATIDKDYTGGEPPIGSIIVEGGEIWVRLEEEGEGIFWFAPSYEHPEDWNSLLDGTNYGITWTVLRWGINE